MAHQLRFLIAECEPPRARHARRASVGESSGETYEDTLRALAPGAACDFVKPADAGSALQDGLDLTAYDAVFLTGSPLHLYDWNGEVRREVEFMQAVFRSGTPAFGSCAGLQLATVAAGGTVRCNCNGREAGFARRIAPTDEGLMHPLLAGRPRAFDAPAIHSDEVESLPAGGTRLASNAVTDVQAAEIRCDKGVFWGVQYHPEISLGEVAAALRRQSQDLVQDGLARNGDDVEEHARLIDALHAQPERTDLAWRLGLDREVTDGARRVGELRNFIVRLVQPTSSERSRR